MMTCLYNRVIAVFLFEKKLPSQNKPVLALLKECYEIINEARSLLGFLSHRCSGFFTEMHFNHETKQSSKFQSNPSLIASSQSTFDEQNDARIFCSYFLICISFNKFCGVLTLWYFGIATSLWFYSETETDNCVQGVSFFIWGGVNS